VLSLSRFLRVADTASLIRRAEYTNSLKPLVSFLAGANQLSIVGGASEGIYDPESRQFIDRTTGQVLDPATAGQVTGTLAGRQSCARSAPESTSRVLAILLAASWSRKLFFQNSELHNSLQINNALLSLRGRASALIAAVPCSVQKP
jgi:hypothetical protein